MATIQGLMLPQRNSRLSVSIDKLKNEDLSLVLRVLPSARKKGERGLKFVLNREDTFASASPLGRRTRSRSGEELGSGKISKIEQNFRTFLSHLDRALVGTAHQNLDVVGSAHPTLESERTLE